jgi:hypothetical protein
VPLASPTVAQSDAVTPRTDPSSMRTLAGDFGPLVLLPNRLSSTKDCLPALLYLQACEGGAGQPHADNHSKLGAQARSEAACLHQQHTCLTAA